MGLSLRVCFAYPYKEDLLVNLHVRDYKRDWLRPPLAFTSIT